MEDHEAVQQLLLQLLSERSPELGARLKQRLNASLASRGLGRFDERAFGHAKFTAFLESVFGDKVTIERPAGAGDVYVSLRGLPAANSAVATPQLHHDQAQIVRSDVWQAFTNPDSRRKRFFDRETKAVRHFVNDGSLVQRDLTSQTERFAEIERIDGETQTAWMRSFLEGSGLNADQKEALEPLASQPYSSSVNAAFTRALGDQSHAWRQRRTALVIAAIRGWAAAHKVEFGDLCVQKDVVDTAIVHEPRLTPREYAVKLLELLNNEDIGRFVIPALLSSISFNTRR